jgi:hypothetical protein
VSSLLQACLGLDIDAGERLVSFHAPRLPEFIDWMRVCGLQVGSGCVDLKLQRYRHSVGVEVTRNEGGVVVRIDV